MRRYFDIGRPLCPYLAPKIGAHGKSAVVNDARNVGAEYGIVASRLSRTSPAQKLPLLFELVLVDLASSEALLEDFDRRVSSTVPAVRAPSGAMPAV